MSDVTKIAMFVVGAVVLFVAAIGLFWEQYYAALGSQGQLVSGTVSRLEVQRAAGSSEVTGIVAHVEFKTANGKRIQSRRSLSPQQAAILHEGGRVAMRYLPMSPRVHEIAAFSQPNHDAAMGRWMQYVLLLFVGAGAIFWVAEMPRLTKPRVNLSPEELGLEPEGAAKG